MTNLLIKTFIKDHKNTKDSKVRQRYGYLGSFVGIISNVVLFSIKLVIGFMLNSIAVIADAFNNLSDVASSVVTLVGFNITNKPADKEHPFGHGRIEYISALIVSFIILTVGVEFIKSSFDRIRNPEPMNFDWISIGILTLSITVKVWLSKFNKEMGRAIGSKAMEASSFDSLSDVITTSVVIVSIILSRWISFPIDGYIGILVAIFILYAGFNIAKDTLNPILGEAPDPNLVKGIQNKVLSYEGITGAHDLIIHNYGPGRCIASIHAEVPDHISIIVSHDIIDQAEKEISQELGVYMLIHMDPVNTNCEITQKIQQQVLEVINDFDEKISIHDFRVVNGKTHKNLVFDIVIPIGYSEQKERETVQVIKEEIHKRYPEYDSVITVDKEYAVLR